MAAWERVKVNTKISQEQTQNNTVPFLRELRAIAFVFMIIICFQKEFAVCTEKEEKIAACGFMTWILGTLPQQRHRSCE